MQISKNGGVPTNDLVIVASTLTQGGTLLVTNLGPNTFTAGNSFKLFTAATFAGAFTNLNLPGLPAGLKWSTNNLAGNGTIAVSNLTYTLTYNAGSNGAVSGTGTQTVNYGASGTAVSAVPTTGYYFAGWSDGSTANPRTDANVTNNLAVTANFATSVAPVIAAGSIAFTGGGFMLGGTGGTGQTYVLLTTSNLVSPVWMPVATNVADTNGLFQFTDPGAISNRQQFYRLRSR